MADVFLSYARADRDAAERIVDDITHAGLTVWWDTEIDTGARFRDVISRELQAARYVIVYWTQSSIRSDFVIDEAQEAKDAGKLKPILAADVLPRDLPHGFRSVQSIEESALPALLQSLLKAEKRSSADPDKEPRRYSTRRRGGSRRTPKSEPPKAASTSRDDNKLSLSEAFAEVRKARVKARAERSKMPIDDAEARKAGDDALDRFQKVRRAEPEADDALDRFQKGRRVKPEADDALDRFQKGVHRVEPDERGPRWNKKGWGRTKK